MIKCKVIKDFTLNDYDKLTDIKRNLVEEKGKLFTGDTFRCDKDMAKYLLGENDKKIKVVELLEVEPETKNKKK